MVDAVQWRNSVKASSSEQLMKEAAAIRDSGFGHVMTYSPKVFVPLTQLCRDVCHYCVFAKSPSGQKAPYMTLEEVLEVAKQGQQQGCREVLFTLGEKPELRYRSARTFLQQHGFESTVDYLAHVAHEVISTTGMLPHINAGTLTREELLQLKACSASMGLMLESSSERLCQPGMPHYRSPDKQPHARLDTLRLAGELRIPMTTGILIGIGETEDERLQSLLDIHELHQRYGHIQEVIVQNFKAKPGTRMAQAEEPNLDTLARTIAAARLLFGAEVSIQAPPNLTQQFELATLIRSGINDWGGISPLTQDFVNPEAPWPQIDLLSKICRREGHSLRPRTTVYPSYLSASDRWQDTAIEKALQPHLSADGFARADNWRTGKLQSPPSVVMDRLLYKGSAPPPLMPSDSVVKTVERLKAGEPVDEQSLSRLFTVMGDDFDFVCQQADQLRQELAGGDVSYVVTRNINYTNICGYRCGFCAFSKSTGRNASRDKPYVLSAEDIAQRVREAWDRGATEVCLQGGIHPSFDGNTYLDICRAAREAAPGIHIHAFSPLEVFHGSQTLGLTVSEFVGQLKQAGLSSIPGTAAEILDDDVRAMICPDKINTQQWLDIIEATHQQGIRSTATIMFGHVDSPIHWARHLLKLLALQKKTGGFTEFVPLPFVAHEAPIALRETCRPGPSFHESVMMHAVARLLFQRWIPNIQTSWVKMGPAGAQACLRAGVNDLGGTLMNESITRAAGAEFGQEVSAQQMQQWAGSVGRSAYQRTTLYQKAPAERIEKAASDGSIQTLCVTGSYSLSDSASQ